MTNRFLRSLLAAVSLILVSANLVKAQGVSDSDLTPRQLLSLARQGRFSSQGIPGYSRLNSAIRSGEVNAQNLVASAVAQNRLPQSSLQDAQYLAAVEEHLHSGGCGTN